MAKEKKRPSPENVKNYLLLAPMIESLKGEISELSKKKPDGVLNVLKVQLINKRLRPMKELLSILPVGEYLDELDEDAMPTNSDTVLILGQYIGAIRSYKTTFYGYSSNKYKHGWLTDKGFIEEKDFE